MNDPKKKLNIQIDPNKAVTTGIELPEDMSSHVLSKAHGDTVNGIVFNLKYIEAHNPELASKIRKLAEDIENTPWDGIPAHEEDQRMLAEEFKKIAGKARDYPHKDS